jgi:hypothetical protein
MGAEYVAATEAAVLKEGIALRVSAVVRVRMADRWGVLAALTVAGVLYAGLLSAR